MNYYCEVCYKFIKPKRKQNHLNSKIHKEADKCRHIKSTIENIDINGVDKTI